MKISKIKELGAVKGWPNKAEVLDEFKEDVAVLSEVAGQNYMRESCLSAEVDLSKLVEFKKLKEYQELLSWLLEQIFDGLDIDGGDLQDKLESLGLIKLVKIPENKQKDYPACAEYETDELYFAFDNMPEWTKGEV